MQDVRKSYAEQYGKLICSLFPRDKWRLPIFLGMTQGQIQQLAGRFIAREVARFLTILRRNECSLSMALAAEMILRISGVYANLMLLT